MALDKNGVKLHGVVATRSGMGARVIWQDGTLYVGTCSQDGAAITAVHSFDSPEEPKRWAGGWKASANGTSLQIQRPTCGCQKCKLLGVLSPEELIARAVPFATEPAEVRELV